MDSVPRWGQDILGLADKIDLEQRLQRFGITPMRRDNLRLVQPVLNQHLFGIAARFYDYIHRFAEARRILAQHDTDALRRKQGDHWEAVFACRFDRDYLVNALGVGHAHFRAKVPPHLYMAGYNFFMSDLLRLVAVEYKGSDMAAATSSISRVVMLDMSLALNAFMIDSLLYAER